MSFDLLVKGGHLPNGEVRDIGIKGDRIVAVEAKLPDEAGKIIDARGQLVSPPFCDPHFHMDATLSYGMPRVNQSGTLFEGIALWGELRQLATREEMVNRALHYIDWAVSMGLLATRTHVDTTPDHLRGVDAMLEVKRRVAPYLELQLVAFPQDGLYRAKNGRENLIRALDRGVDIVGGIPHFERTMEEGAESVKDVARIAADRGLMLDIHCDETDDPMSRHIAVGRDMRKSSPALSDALMQGMQDFGADVIDLGLVDTPFVYFAINHLGCCGGVQVTASHNPAEYNGFKISRAKAKPVGQDTGLTEIQRLAALVEREKLAPRGGHRESRDLWKPYREHLLRLLDPQIGRAHV